MVIYRVIMVIYMNVHYILICLYETIAEIPNCVCISVYKNALFSLMIFLLYCFL